MNIYDTYFMLAAVEELPPMRTFFHSRYFATNANLDIFGTSRVYVDFMGGSKKMAPFVMPRIGGISILRDGFKTFELEPPNISLKRALTIDQLKERGFGEALNSMMTPADREQQTLINDLRELDDRITRREEWMAVQTILNNGCIMKHITDREDVAFEETEARYYDGADNPAVYTPAAPWAKDDESWRKDVRAMAKALTSRGLPATDLIMSADVGDFVEEDEWFKARLDNRRMDYGSLAPAELPDGATFLGRLNFGGNILNLIISGEDYEGDDGGSVPYLPPGSVIVTAPDCGRTIYGGVTQMEDDETFHTVAGSRVPKYDADKKHDTKEVRLTSKPLMAPRRMNPWMVAKNVFN
jgi:hypothetical protein